MAKSTEMDFTFCRQGHPLCRSRLAFSVDHSDSAFAQLVVSIRTESMIQPFPRNRTVMLLRHEETSGRVILTVADFVLPAPARALGIARFLLSRVYEYISNNINPNPFVAGRISPDEFPDKENKGRRDRLWRDLCGYSQGHEGSMFSPAINGVWGEFYGPMLDPWDPQRNRTLVVIDYNTSALDLC